MRKVFIGLLLFVVFVVAIKTVRHIFRGVHITGNEISFRVTEDDNRYQVFARYDRSRSHDVQRYLDHKLRTTMFRNSDLDATVTLDDNTSFYINNSPGRLVIKFNRGENSDEAFERMRDLAEGLKERLEDY